MTTRRRIKTRKAQILSYEAKETLPEFLAQIEDLVKDIPSEQRKNIMVDWSNGDEYDASCIEFTHYRDETDEELKARTEQELVKAARLAIENERQERAALAQLKLKYEKTS